MRVRSFFLHLVLLFFLIFVHVRDIADIKSIRSCRLTLARALFHLFSSCSHSTCSLYSLLGRIQQTDPMALVADLETARSGGASKKELIKLDFEPKFSHFEKQSKDFVDVHFMVRRQIFGRKQRKSSTVSPESRKLERCAPLLARLVGSSPLSSTFCRDASCRRVKRLSRALSR